MALVQHANIDQWVRCSKGAARSHPLVERISAQREMALQAALDAGNHADSTAILMLLGNSQLARHTNVVASAAEDGRPWKIQVETHDQSLFHYTTSSLRLTPHFVLPKTNFSPGHGGTHIGEAAW